MTNETRQRIEAYKKLLPDLREQVMAVAILLIMSISMMVSASFAWITLSRAPEMTGMQTTVASNGNLEIALAQGLTKDPIVAPGESAIGDSSAAEGQSIVDANVTWGNLVNVSDPTYGLSKIALRPALLSSYNRKDYPLNGATYGKDGRVLTTNERYEFASYAKVEGSNDYYFAAGDKVNYGVRAISSIGYANYSGNARIDNYRNDTNQLYNNANTKYGKIVSDGSDAYVLDEASGVTCISALEGLVTVFAQDRINGMGLGYGENTKTSCSPYLWYLYQMMLLLQDVLDEEGKALLEMANWQAYVYSGDLKTEKTFSTIDELIGASNAVLESKGVELSTLSSYKKSLTDLKYCLDGIEPKAQKCQNPDAPEVDYYWDDIASYVNRLVEINTTTMNGIALKDASSSNALTLIKGGDVIVYNGALVDIEKRLVNNTYRVQAAVKVTVYTTLLGTKTVKGTVYTDAYGDDASYSVDVAYSDGLESSAKGDATAKDTYGMAIDLWIRTNYPGAVLTLEGAAKYEEQRATITVEGVKYDLYTISVGEGDLKTEIDVYQKEENWYDVSTMTVVNSDTMDEQIPKEKYVPVIVGYEGENRIWEDWRELLEGGYIKQDATTQGAGSCFVFYASTPTEQAKIMEMLEAFNVAFMDQSGNILGTAQLNRDSAYANQGKVTVPLEVTVGTEYVDESGMTRKGITQLEQNKPLLVTAIVYLNGSKLENENVLADGELEGQLNIQFGTDSTLIAPDDEKLQSQARSITAEVTVNGQTISNGTIGGTEGLEYKAGGYKAKVELTVEGEQPQNISGFFVRVINSTQGTRGEEKTFTYDASTEKWIAEFTLTNPGTYAFNTLLVDGVQYTLHDGSELSGINTYYPSNRPHVYIKGLKVVSVNVGLEPGTYMTADSSMPLPVTVKLESAITPKQVRAQFFNMNNTKQYTAILTYDAVSEQWVGAANINSSDTYTLKYISVDGDTMDAPVSGNYTLYLGLKANVSTVVPENDRKYDFIGQSTQFEMIVRVFDDSGKAIENLSNVKLYYNNIISPATMTWTGTYYKGVLDATRPGQMSFNRLELGSAGTISNVTGAPVFLARSLEKPVYVYGKAKHENLVAIGESLIATMDVVLEHGESAVVWAEIEKDVNGITELRYIEGVRTSDDLNIITFNLPREDGKWTLKRLFLQGVYDTDSGKWYDEVDGIPNEDNSFVLLPNEGEQLTTDLIVSYNVAVSYDGKEQGKYNSLENTSTVNTFTVDLTGGNAGTFLTEYTTKAITVEITDYKHRKIDDITTDGSQLELTYNALTSEAYGGYTRTSSASNDNKKLIENITINGKEVAFGTVSLKQSGEYNTTSFKISLGTAGTIDVLVRPKFTISSVKPTVKITGISPSGSNPAKITYTTKSLSWGRGTEPTFTATGNQTSTFNDTTATVYALATADNSTQRHGGFTRPTVTLTVAGVNSGSAVSMTLPAGSANAVTFSRTGNGTITGTLGTVSQINSWTSNFVLTHTLQAYYGHGTQSISSMKITNSGDEYTVTFDTPITINNPSSVNQ